MMELNRVAIEGLVSHPGAVRHGEISISGTEYVPPPPAGVAELVDEMCDYVNDNKFPYYDALDAADAAWKDAAKVDVSKMGELLGEHLAAQLLEVFHVAKGE